MRTRKLAPQIQICRRIKEIAPSMKIKKVAHHNYTDSTGKPLHWSSIHLIFDHLTFAQIRMIQDMNLFEQLILAHDDKVLFIIQ